MKAEIFYANIPHPVGNEFGSMMYKQRYNTSGDITIPIGQFRHYWTKVAEEDIDTRLDILSQLEEFFAKYNMDDMNPLGKIDGQKKLREIGVRHTSMSVFDIIKVGKDYYMVAPQGYRKVIFS